MSKGKQTKKPDGDQVNMRDMFAMAALPKVIDGFYMNAPPASVDINPSIAASIAEISYMVADAMITERGKAR
ncbi:hypothetical protein [Providencia phage Kokobel2]|nr:hypothetical protein [Providencia phage Kokobel2]